MAFAEGRKNGHVVAVRNAGPIRGFSVDVVVPAEAASPSSNGIDGLAFFEAGEVLQLSRRLNVGGRTVTRVAAIFRDGASFPGDGSLFSIRIEDVSPEVIRLERVQFLDISGGAVPGVGSPTNVIDAVPVVRTALLQNIPNPFNPETKIRYQLPNSGEVVLKIFDILGREVKSLVNEKLEAGFHEVTWNGRNNSGRKVSSGVYYYQIRASEFKETKKMILMK
ncbi:T9SS type A sorting domain-containing protein [candidate division KSB1 bacterium]|nr:T9SS type A sorting domain-containing protein [candidate division KSB1 bacterium]